MQATQEVLSQVKILLLQCFWWTWTCPNCQELPHFRPGALQQYYWKTNFELRMQIRGCSRVAKFRLPTAEIHCHSYTETLNLHRLACSWMEHFASEKVSVASNTTKSSSISVLWTCSKYHLQLFPLSRVGSIQRDLLRYEISLHVAAIHGTAGLTRACLDLTWVLGHTREAVQISHSSVYLQEKQRECCLIITWPKNCSVFRDLQF